ncbi:hypothetical protein CQY20_09305 [Mycolicibacterium agri]|uniref:VWFA domain-containing protein n=1 Tax=Mycolicibacterium agri TaxID=36811 RepID=A0A2A7N7B0_MYCAG|nr:VWA domain-containing protein [Mycolicibacterium agri]PEG39740.1 hypothetical protein CQY20_09305 [Mycolicibacterium agri]GFG52551.1 hypothetical protein MAGR_39920 [Mycolicibacterium agri]
MTFQPVLPLPVLIAFGVVIVALRLLSMRRLHMTAGSQWATVWRWCGLTLAVLLVLIAAARPGIEHGNRDVTQPQAASGVNTNVFFIVDRSPDTRVTDYGDGEARIAGIRADIDALIERHRQARFAVISFSSRSSLDWPLSDDAWSLEPTVDRLSAYDGSGTETADRVNAAAAANVLRYQLIAAGQQYPGSDNLVYYFGSGASGSRAPQGEFDPIPGSVDGGAVFGYGAARNEPGLQRIADQLDLPYVHRQAGEPVADFAQEVASAHDAKASVPQRTELYWFFALVAAVLLLFETFTTLREYRRTRMTRRDVTL